MEGGLVDDQRIGSKRGRDEKDVKSSDGVGRLEKRPSGIVLMEEYSYSYSGDEMINGVKYEEEKETETPSSSPAPAPAPPAGLFNQLISNLVSSPRSNETRDVFELQSEKKINGDHSGDGAAAAGGGEGVISSNGGEVTEQVAAEEDGGGGGNEKDGDGSENNPIDDIVAQLPRTLSEDTAPATDEASILIHSIIHD